MKKKMIIIIAICLILCICIFSLIFINNKTVATIILDINPSIEINLLKNKKVKNIKALNNDAKEIIENNFKGKSLDDVLKDITKNVINKGYVEDNQVAILLYATENIDNEELQNKIRNIFGEKEIYADVIVIDKITKEDEKIAKKYNISISKAAYINSITKENDNLNVDNILTKPIKELNEMKNTGNYCEEGYFLEGDFCFKEINRENAISGKVCPKGYYEYKGICYEEAPVEDSDNLVCNDNFKLVDNKCVRTLEVNAKAAKYSCTKGEEMTRAKAGLTDSNAGDANDIVCVDTTNVKHPMTPCELPASDPTERMSSGGKCYWHKAPVIEAGCPGKIQVNGFCWDDATNIYICEGARDGKQYKSKDEICENSIKYIEPTITEYKCEDKNARLNGTKCLIEEVEDARHERYCQNGYNLIDDAKCLNFNNIKNKENGYVCKNENSKLKDNVCIIYETVEAKHN